jgi:NADH-quinone oxidoreductase subunit N
MSLTATLLATYGLSLATGVVALALDALRLRNPALMTAESGLFVSALVGLFAGVLHTPVSVVGPVVVGGAASMVFGVIALVGAVAIAGGYDSLAASEHGGSVAALVALSVAAAGATALANDLVTLLLVIEASALAAYALVAVARTARSGEAAMKYFVQGAVATALLLFGAAILLTIYEPSGRYDLVATALGSAVPPFPALAGTGLVICALVFKMGAAPFHSWAPDAYETALPESAAFLSSGPKLAAIAAAGTFAAVAGSGSLEKSVVAAGCGLAVASVLIGSVAALRQADYRRMLGYAGVAQSGYALIAVATLTPSLGVFFGATYALAAVGTFLAASAFSRARPGWDGSISGLAGLGREAPILSGAVGVLLISLAGLPPFLGFWAKLLVFGTGVSRAVDSIAATPGTSWSYIIAVGAGLLGSVVSLGYYGGVLRSLFFDEAPSASDRGEVADEGGRRAGSAAVWVVVIAAVVLVVGVVPMVSGSSALIDLFTLR